MQNRKCIEINLTNNNRLNVNKNAIVSNDISSSSEEEDNESNDGNINYKGKVNKDLLQIQNETSKAIEEELNKTDPNDQVIYDYDATYDAINREREHNRQMIKHNQSKGPKYMKAIIESSQKSKIEIIKMKEKVLSDKLKRETGTDDVPVFITKKYQEVLDDLNKKSGIEENEDKNTINNKEFGMMGFYSHLLTKNKLYSNNEENNCKEDISKVYQNRKKEYERNLPQVNLNRSNKNTDTAIESKDDDKTGNNNNKDNEGNISLNKKEEYFSRYLQRKKNRENKAE